MTDPAAASAADLTVPSLILAAIFAAGGSVALLAAVFDWDWFFSTSSARLVSGERRGSGRRRARLIYAAAGAAILAGAALLLFGQP